MQRSFVSPISWRRFVIVRERDKMDTEVLVDDPSSLRYVLSPVTVLSCCYILLCAFVISPILLSRLGLKSKRVAAHKAFFNSLLGSMTHHLFVFALATYALASGAVSSRAVCKSPLGFALVQTTLGYFVGDLIVMLSDPVMGNDLQIVLHHAVAVTGLAIVLYTKGMAMFVAISFQLLELSSFLLDIILAMEKLDCRKDSALYWTAGSLMVVTFVLSRLATIPWHWYEYIVFIAPAEILPLPVRFYVAFHYLFFDSLSLLWFTKIVAAARSMVMKKHIKSQ